MAMKLRRTAIALASTLVVIGVLSLLAYRATQQVPSFYQASLLADRRVQEAAANELGSRATALYNDVREKQEWHAVFTEEQINGWLAVQLLRDHPDLLPDDVRDPRIALLPQQMTLAAQTDHNGLTTVVSVNVGLYVHEPDVIACRFYSAYAGKLRLPLHSVLDEITRVADTIDLPLRWAQTDGDPVALLEVSQIPGIAQNDGQQIVRLDNVELHEGQLYLAGHTGLAEQAETGSRRTDSDLPKKTSAVDEPERSAGATFNRR